MDEVDFVDDYPADDEDFPRAATTSWPDAYAWACTEDLED